MKDIRIRTVPHNTQRYPTVGDYEETSGRITIRVSWMRNWRYEALVAVHELVEKMLTKERGIPEWEIDAFDLAFEAQRADGNTDEPGHDAQCPYRREHVFAERIERELARELGVDWDTYDAAVMSL